LIAKKRKRKRKKGIKYNSSGLASVIVDEYDVDTQEENVTEQIERAT